MKNAIIYTLVLFSTIVICAFIYILFWGMLFPYSPVFIGFNEHKLNNTTIYVQEGAKFSEFVRFDTLTRSVEEFHELRFRSKPKIIIFKDDESYLQRSTTKARFCAFSSGSLVVSPWALQEDNKGIISLEIYLRHELSHLLIFDYVGFLAEFRYPDWLLEGIAMYSAKQMGTSFYPSIPETYQLIREGNFMPPEFFKTSREDEVSLTMKHKIAFIYSEFGCIVDYLIRVYGKDRFIEYMKALIDGSDNDSVFQEVFKRSFDDMISDFKEAVYQTRIQGDTMAPSQPWGARSGFNRTSLCDI